MAATRISAPAQISFRFFVLEWQMVTVAFSPRSSSATGFPTRLLLPTTTACFPAICTPVLRISSIIPPRRAGYQPGHARTPAPLSLPPSDHPSLFEINSLKHCFLAQCAGSGNWTREAMNILLLLYSSIRQSSSCSVVLWGKRFTSDFMPRAMHAFSLIVDIHLGCRVFPPLESLQAQAHSHIFS